MPYEDILVHRATPLRSVTSDADADDWVEGDYSPQREVRGTPFDCCLFLPSGTPQPSAALSRQVRVPTLLVAALDDAGAPPVLAPEDELLVVAEELNLQEGRAMLTEVRWQVEGTAQPFGRPGDDVIGSQATLKRVEEGPPERAAVEG